MISQSDPGITGVLLSGGIDSAVLLSHLLAQGQRVQPFYIRSGLQWEAAERSAVGRLLGHLAGPRLDSLVEFELPLADLYDEHWSLAGTVPSDATPDEAVYLPGRNPLLLIKPALWCGMRGITRLAVGTLRGNPFADATDDFFNRFASMTSQAIGMPVTIEQPLAQLDKHQVLLLGRNAPLAETFSCLQPIARQHCGRCNKCGERRAAFRAIRQADPTRYALSPNPVDTPCFK